MRACLPQSPGLPPSEVREDQGPRNRHRRRHPATRTGRLTPKDTEELVNTVMAEMNDKTPEALAVQTGRGIALVRKAIVDARTSLQERVQEYVDQHLIATVNAAAKGDSRPAEWALERIEEGGERVVTPPAVAAPPALQPLSIGIMLGGVTPMQLPPVPPSQPALEGEVVKP